MHHILLSYRTENIPVDENEKENYNPFLCFQELMDMEKQKGDGLRALVVRFCDGPE
jgi:hypothetical protein